MVAWNLFGKVEGDDAGEMEVMWGLETVGHKGAWALVLATMVETFFINRIQFVGSVVCPAEKLLISDSLVD